MLFLNATILYMYHIEVLLLYGTVLAQAEQLQFVRVYFFIANIYESKLYDHKTHLTAEHRHIKPLILCKFIIPRKIQDYTERSNIWYRTNKNLYSRTKCAHLSLV